MEARLEKDIEEAIAELLLKLDNHLKALQTSPLAAHDDHGRRISLNGTNVGASTTVHPSNSHGSDGSFSINIYVNNNVQGVNNSILLGSNVSMRDPGATLHLPSCYNRQYEKTNASTFEKSMLEKKARKASWSAPFIGLCCLLLVIALFILF